VQDGWTGRRGNRNPVIGAITSISTAEFIAGPTHPYADERTRRKDQLRQLLGEPYALFRERR